MKMKMKMNRTGVCYARQSTEMQQSIPAQLSELEDYAKTNDIQIIASFQDVMSGKNTERNGFQAMKEYIATHSIDVILVWRHDRLARNLKELQNFLLYCQDNETTVISINERLSNNKAQDTLLIHLLGAIGEYQLDTIKDNQQIAYRKMHQEGKKVNQSVSFGYRIIDDELEIIKEEAEIVHLIFQLYVEEDLGYKAIAEHLNNLGILNWNEKLWTPARIHSILKNTSYIGNIRSKYGDENRHLLPIIEKELFQKAVNKMNSKGKQAQRVTRRYILQKKIRCPHCRSLCSPTHTTQKHKDHHYYICSNYIANGKRHCHGIILNAIEIEQFISNKAHQFIQSDYVSGQLKKRIANKNGLIVKSNQRKQQQLKERQQKALQSFERGLIDDDQLKSQLISLSNREKKLKIDPTIPESLIELINFNLAVDINPTLSQFTLYQSIIDKIEVNGDKTVKEIYLTDLEKNILQEELL
ncbi:recombinase family protein [Fundicoccus culcitae]|uniref:Recombinase family protein n=1 Tax=Fundicoccus culcitae TaxID=2969821 RepID=A0ABY5P3U2_9LACT|nr:recombinase family protein [Fundicoccus culcitae]UUX33265.1 recombinase family protein [Fundicoccus culcitae]